MSDKVSSVEIRLTGKDAGATTTLSGIGRSLEQLSHKAKSLEQTFGEERGFKKLLEGGLIGFGAERVAGALEKAVELRNLFNEGKLDAAGLTVEVGKSLP